MSSHRQNPRPRRPTGRPRRRRLALGAVLLGIAAIGAGVSFAGAADPSLSDRIDSAQSDSSQLSDRIDAQASRLAGLQSRARAAGARAMELQAQLDLTAQRQRRLAGDLTSVEEKLAAVRARYKKAVGVLSDRLVEIYKNPAPDAINVILDANGVADLESRAAYLSALHDADQAIADRVASLRDEVQGRYREIADLKAQIDAEAAHLRDARAQFASAQAAAQDAAGQVSDALAGNQADLQQVQSRLADLEAQQQRQQAASAPGSAFLGGPYSIPTYIVMCESGGNYHALNPSSGAGGAYQILPSTWAAYGGHGAPQDAPKAEQDRIAAEIWADSGPSAWACA